MRRSVEAQSDVLKVRAGGCLLEVEPLLVTQHRDACRFGRHRRLLCESLKALSSTILRSDI
jgi:hypothetical protein